MKSLRSAKKIFRIHTFPDLFLRPFLIILTGFLTVSLGPAWAITGSTDPLLVTALIPRDVPPTYYLDKKTGMPAGFAVDVMNKIAQRAGVNVAYIFGENWADIFERMKRGEADIVPDFGITDERKKILMYGPPLETFQNSFFVRSNTSGVYKIEESASVGVMAGSIPNAILATRPSLRLVRFNSYQHALFDLLAGRIDAVAGPIPTILTLARDSGVEDKIREVGPPFSEIKRAIAVRKDNVQLFNRLTRATEEFVATSEYRELYLKWYGTPPPFWTPRRIIAVSCVILFVSITGMLLWRYRSVLTLNRELTKNIAERRQAEEALGLTEERYRGIVESQTEFISRHRPGGILTYVNDALAQYTGKEPAQLLGKSFYRFIHENDREAVIKSIESMTKRNPVTTVENRVTLSGGKTGWQQWTNRALFDGNGNIIEYQSVGRDITERKHAEEALRASRDFIERMVDTVDEGFIVIDPDYRIIQANKAFCRQSGLPLDEIIGKHCYTISHHRDTPCFDAGESCAVRDCFEKGAPSTYVHKHYHKDRSLIYTETKSYPLNDASGKVTSAMEVINNITDKYLLEEQLLRTQKLEAIGLLAGGIAHDFNNLLQGVFGNISLAKTYLNKEDKVHHILDGTEAALNQATNLTKQLLTFARGGAPVKKVISLGPVIQNAAKFALSGSRLDCSMSIAENLSAVEADEGQIGQVIGNIVLNAGEAMPNGGTIELAARDITLDRKSAAGLQPGNYVLITIEDKGHGIPDSYISRIFDPYFTTKQTGSGLGLATAHAIVNKHGGAIQVNSRMGAGSVFSIYLPVSREAAAPAKVEDKSMLTGRGRILIMDDEKLITEVAGRMIERLGYEADFAINGEEAIEKYSEALRMNKPYNAVILDLTVHGGMGGREAIEKLREIDPAVRGVVSSGYSDDDIMSNYKQYGFQAVLSKPYRMEGLSKMLHNLLKYRTGDSRFSG